MQTYSINIQKLLFLKLIKFLNVAGPIAGFTAALSPLILFFWNYHPQFLEIGATFTRNDQTIRLELASQPKQIRKRLKFRWDIPSNQGMLFLLKKPETLEINTNHNLMSLDIIFLKDGIVKSIVKNAPPCNFRTECPKYSSKYPVNQMIQLPRGSISTINLKPEDKIKLKMLNS